MDEKINKKSFFKTMSQLNRQERLTIATELCVASEPRLQSQLIPGAMISEIVLTRTRVLVKQKVSNWCLWKLWVFVMKPEGDLKNWRMTTTQCYRIQPRTATSSFHQQYEYYRPASNQSRRRRAIIRDCNGHAVPRRWLDRFAPHIRTQEDWDRGSIYRGSTTNFSK